MRRVRAITLLELLVAVAVMAVLVGAMAYAFSAGAQFERTAARQRIERGQVEALETRLTRLIQGAILPARGETDGSTYFTGSAESGDSTLGAERLTFLTTERAVPLAARESEDDFETQHEVRGPMGGLAEVSLSLTPVGDAGDKTGLFERLQRPADSDPDQGGVERVLLSGVTKLGFEFYNGTEWVSSWETSTDSFRLPAAVRVNYVLDSESATRRLIVSIPTSDVTPDDPADTQVSA